MKLFNGFTHFIGRDDHFNSLLWNEMLLDKREELSSLDQTDINVLHIIRFTTCEMNDNISVLESNVDCFKSTSGNDVTLENMFAKEISELYENTNLNSWPDLNIKYKKDLSPFEDANAKVFSYYVSLYNLYLSLKNLQGNVFEGNVRYFDSSSKINSDIIDTLKGQECTKFHLLNNGITIVCSKCSTNSPNDSIMIKKGSIINGAQTVGCVIKAIDECLRSEGDISRYENSYVSVKVIEIDNKQELIDELVYTLNTQNQMRSSYSLSNDSQIKTVQKDINNNTKYFLQIKNNEFSYQKQKSKNFNKLKRDIIDIETAIQSFVTFEDINDLAYISKNSKALLFTEENRKVIIDEISMAKVIESYEAFLAVMRITSLYRSYRKDSNKNTILNLLSIDQKEIDNFKFINTGNFLILFALGLYCRKNNVQANEETVVIIIKLLTSLFVDSQNISNATKTKDTFEKARELVENL